MTIQSNLRRNPFTGAYSYRKMDDEIYTIAELSELPGIYGLQLQDKPQAGTVTVTENVTGGSEFNQVTVDPSAGQCRIDYTAGYIIFNSADDGKEVIVEYYGGGSNMSKVNLEALVNNQETLETLISKNYIINGSMDIAQRGTSFAAIASSGYSLDRWLYAKSGDMGYTITQDTDVPTGGIFTKSIKIDCTTADTAVDAGDYALIVQRIEGNILKSLYNKTATLSFWVKATKTGTYCVSIRDSSTSYSYVAEYTINESETWEYKTLTFTIDTTSGTWNTNNTMGGYLTITLMSGSTRQTTAGTWQAGNYVATSNQVNACDSTDNNFWITGVMLNEGTVAAPFQPFGGTYESDLRACERRYKKSYNLTTAPGTASTTGCLQRAARSTAFIAGFDYQRMAKAPTVTIYSTKGTAAKVCTTADADIGTTVTADNVGECGIRSLSDSGSGFTSGLFYQFHYTADAEL